MRIMKNVSNWAMIKGTTAVLKPLAFLFLFVSLLFSSALEANDTIHKVPTDIKYVGSNNGNPVLQITVDNKDGETAYLVLSDEFGNTFYSDVIKDKKYSKSVQFENIDLNDLKLTLTIRSKNGQQKQAFQISKSTRTVEEVHIAKL
jgi:hypothetical protein